MPVFLLSKIILGGVMAVIFALVPNLPRKVTTHQLRVGWGDSSITVTFVVVPAFATFVPRAPRAVFVGGPQAQYRQRATSFKSFHLYL